MTTMEDRMTPSEAVVALKRLRGEMDEVKCVVRSEMDEVNLTSDDKAAVDLAISALEMWLKPVPDYGDSSQ